LGRAEGPAARHARMIVNRELMDLAQAGGGRVGRAKSARRIRPSKAARSAPGRGRMILVRGKRVLTRKGKRSKANRGGQVSVKVAPPIGRGGNRFGASAPIPPALLASEVIPVSKRGPPLFRSTARTGARFFLFPAAPGGWLAGNCTATQGARSVARSSAPRPHSNQAGRADETPGPRQPKTRPGPASGLQGRGEGGWRDWAGNGRVDESSARPGPCGLGPRPSPPRPITIGGCGGWGTTSPHSAGQGPLRTRKRRDEAPSGKGTSGDTGGPRQHEADVSGQGCWRGERPSC